MAAGEFVITEYPPGSLPGEGEVFIWTAAREQITQSGARAAPTGPWTMSGKQRTVRTDYPGARLPSEQVLGPQHEPFTWQGRWDDRYNRTGYACDERDRFEAMCRRGNVVEVKFQELVFYGIITEWSFAYRRRWDIGYRFTVSVHSRSGDDALDRAPAAPEQPGRALEDVEILSAATATASATKPAWAMSTPLISDVSTGLGLVSKRMSDISKALDTRTGVLKPIGDATKLALQFQALKGECQGVVVQLVSARSDVNMGVRTALGVLDFEAWARSTSNLMRLAMGRSQSAAKALRERDTAKTKAVYRPHKGESLYSISRKAYGTPNAWQVIFAANRLTTVTMAGTETLLIPERGPT